MFQWFRARQQRTAAAKSLYDAIVSQARHPEFYLHAGVADTISGRFEMIVVHVFAVLERLKREGEEGNLLGQRLLETFVRTTDHELREMGVGDTSVPKKLKGATEALYGRMQAYAAAVRDEDPTVFRAALTRNVFEETDDDSVKANGAALLAGYTERVLRHLGPQPSDALLSGQVTFPHHVIHMADAAQPATVQA